MATNTRRSASSLGMMSDEEKKLQRIEDIKELLS
jgi:DNA repair protein RAD5